MVKKMEGAEKKSVRILKIMKRLYQKEIINRNDLKNEFNVSIKTIQRDIDTLKTYFLEENHSD